MVLNKKARDGLPMEGGTEQPRRAAHYWRWRGTGFCPRQTFLDKITKDMACGSPRTKFADKDDVSFYKPVMFLKLVWCGAPKKSALFTGCCCLVIKSCPTLCDTMDCSLPGFPVHGIFQQEYWSGLLFPYPGDLPNPGIEHTSPILAGRFFTTESISSYFSCLILHKKSPQNALA